jgi:hypothetical protein
MARNLHSRIVRVQVIVDEMEREAFRQVAEQEGKSLSGWLRESALQRLEARKAESGIASAAGLKRFFKACRLREKEREPDWEPHLRMMEESRQRGRSGT